MYSKGCTVEVFGRDQGTEGDKSRVKHRPKWPNWTKSETWVGQNTNLHGPSKQNQSLGWPVLGSGLVLV